MNPRASIHRCDDATEFYTPERCFIVEVANTPDDPHLSIARARVAPGVVTRWHRVAATTERYVILEGTGRVEIGDLEPQDLHPGDVAIIPPGVRQRITNTGAEDLLFLAICTPRFRQENYQDIDDERAPQASA